MGCCLNLRLIIFDLNVLERSSLAFLLLLDLGSRSGIEGNEKDPSYFFMYEFLLHSLALFFCVMSRKRWEFLVVCGIACTGRGFSSWAYEWMAACVCFSCSCSFFCCFLGVGNREWRTVWGFNIHFHFVYDEMRMYGSVSDTHLREGRKNGGIAWNLFTYLLHATTSRHLFLFVFPLVFI